MTAAALSSVESPAACPAAGPIVCCPSLPDPRRLPWFRMALGIFVACQTMLLGLTVNLAGADDPATLLLLQLGMLAATTVVLLLLGLPLAASAARQLRHGTMSMELFFLLGIAAAFAISTLSIVRRDGPVYFEVVNILLVIYSIGQAINSHSRQKAIAAAGALAAPASTARLCPADSAELLVDATTIEPDDRVRVLPGEIIPVDGQVIEGASLVRQTAFSGEWTSVVRQPGDSVLAGTAAEDGMLMVQATSPGRDRRVDRLARLIQSACESQSATQRLAERFVRIFLPVVLIVALLAGAFWTWQSSWHQGLFTALAVILVACPCAAGLAVPLTMWSLLGRLAHRGLAVRSAEAIERLAAADTVVFDKTGTLADQILHVEQLTTDPAHRTLALALIAQVERHSTHPVAQALRSMQVPPDAPTITLQSIRTLPALGIEADVLINSSAPHRVRLLRRLSPANDGLLQIDLTLDDQWLATATLRERLRNSAAAAIERFREIGLSVIIMTGDASSAARRASSVAEVRLGLSPEDKLKQVQTMAADGHRILYIGDGVNDAAAMARSHVSVALATGDEVAIETASATLHGGNLATLPEAVLLARSAMRTIRSNLIFAAGYNLIGMVAAATGYLHPIVAAVLMSASSLFVAWRSTWQGQPGQSRVEAGVAGHPTPSLALPHGGGEDAPTLPPLGGENDGPVLLPLGAEERASALLPLGGGWEGVEYQDSRLRSLLTIALHAHPGHDASHAPAASTPLPRIVASVRPSYRIAHYLGLIGQAALLIPLAQLSLTGASLAIALFAILAWTVVRWSHRLPVWLDHTLAMVSLGGLGMNLGWWLDVDWSSAINPDGTVRSCCAMSETMIATTHASSHWMYWGMLLLGVPAMYLLRRVPERFSFRKWCCIGPLILGVPAMCFGMWAGAQLAATLTGLSPQTRLLADYALMMLGMCAGMLLPHAAELALSPANRNRS